MHSNECVAVLLGVMSGLLFGPSRRHAIAPRADARRRFYLESPCSPVLDGHEVVADVNEWYGDLVAATHQRLRCHEEADLADGSMVDTCALRTDFYFALRSCSLVMAA